MKIIKVSKSLFNPISLPGMGRSIDVMGLSQEDILEARQAFSTGELFVEFLEEPDNQMRVKQIWANPHSPQITLFV